MNTEDLSSLTEVYGEDLSKELLTILTEEILPPNQHSSTPSSEVVSEMVSKVVEHKSTSNHPLIRVVSEHTGQMRVTSNLVPRLIRFSHENDVKTKRSSSSSSSKKSFANFKEILDSHKLTETLVEVEGSDRKLLIHGQKLPKFTPKEKNPWGERLGKMYHWLEEKPRTVEEFNKGDSPLTARSYPKFLATNYYGGSLWIGWRIEASGPLDDSSTTIQMVFDAEPTELALKQIELSGK